MTCEEAKKSKRKRLEWCKASEAALLELWSCRVEELRGLRKNGHIHAEMADELQKLGFPYSARAVHVKLQNFTQRYRKEKAAKGGLPSTWPQYERVHQIIGGFKANIFPELKLESIDDSSSSSVLLSTCTSLAEPASPLFPVSSSPAPNTSTSSVEPEKKKRKFDFKATIMESLEKLSTDISEHFKKSEENERQLIEIEKKKADCLESIARDNSELKNAFISYLNKNKRKNTLLFK